MHSNFHLQLLGPIIWWLWWTMSENHRKFGFFHGLPLSRNRPASYWRTVPYYANVTSYTEKPFSLIFAPETDFIFRFTSKITLVVVYISPGLQRFAQTRESSLLLDRVGAKWSLSSSRVENKTSSTKIIKILTKSISRELMSTRFAKIAIII